MSPNHEDHDPVPPPDLPDEAQQEEEFVALVTRHQVSLLAFLLSIIPSQADAEDILQRANLVLWRKRGQFERGTNFKAWAFSVARWEALAFLKKRKRENWLVFNDDLTALVAERLASIPDVSIESHPEALRKCLSRLSAAHRKLILDRYQTGRSIKDCAERFGRTESGLRVTLHRIRITLRRCINHHHQADPA